MQLTDRCSHSSAGYGRGASLADAGHVRITLALQQRVLQHPRCRQVSGAQAHLGPLHIERRGNGVNRTNVTLAQLSTLSVSLGAENIHLGSPPYDPCNLVLAPYES